MPGKQHQVLVFKGTVWLSLSFDMEQDSQHWRVYERLWRNGDWWLGLIPKGYMDMKNKDLPKPILKAYAFTEWTRWETPKRPNGTDLWVEYKLLPNKFDVWYSPRNWFDVLDTEVDEWEYMGDGYWEGGFQSGPRIRALR